MKRISTWLTGLCSFILCCAIVPVQVVYAQGSEEVNRKGMLTNMYFLIGWVVLLIVFLFLWLNSKRRASDNNGPPGRSFGQKFAAWGAIVSLIGLAVSIVAYSWSSQAEERTSHHTGEATMMHIHGLGYSVDGDRLLIPSHHGLTKYEDGKWSGPTGEMHDYMGFTMVDDGFYSSGHPEQGTGYKEPFGIIKVGVDEKTINVLDFQGEVDFHEMAVGFKTHAIYAVVHEANSKISAPGLYYSLDDTKTWNRSNVEGFRGAVFSMSVHPLNEAIVVIGNENGTYLSNDYGNRFERIEQNVQTTAVSFTPEAELFIAGLKENKDKTLETVLSRYGLESRKMMNISIPDLDGDAIQYVIQNPKRENEWVFSTYPRMDVYLSRDQGITWTIIADKGKGLHIEE